MQKKIRILGIRGVPAAHGGFETFAERLALYLVSRGWKVSVYCQIDGNGDKYIDTWHGIERINIPISLSGPKATILFDLKSTFHAAAAGELCLTLGYNTAIFCVVLRLRKIKNVINMDGIEWRRQKWGKVAKIWFWINDWAGCWLANHLVADNPGIKSHLLSRVREGKISTIPYGADRIESISSALISKFSLDSSSYWTVIARPEPENSILEIVRAFSRCHRGVKLVVLGNYDVEKNAYHRAILNAASSEVIFLGAIYDPEVVSALRYHAIGYIHGHQVGGTNPSLVEAMGAGNAILAHDNVFNRWVAGETAEYFGTDDECAAALDRLIGKAEKLATMRVGALRRFDENFTWLRILRSYEDLLVKLC